LGEKGVRRLSSPGRQFSDRRLAAFPAIALFLGASTALPGVEGDLISYVPFSTVAPQDIAHDDEDGTYWVTAFLDNEVVHYSSGLRTRIESFESPLSYPTGIAYNSVDRTILVASILLNRIVEIDKAGVPTGRAFDLVLEPIVNANSGPAPRGMTFDRTGDEGRGSIYLIETMGTLIYELALDGRVIRYFPHPDDPDGYPGRGGTAHATDIDLIYDQGALTGFYVTGGRNRLNAIRKLDRDGTYTGISIPLEDAGGSVSGILRQVFERPDNGEKTDSYICVVESNARFAILEGGEPPFHEVLDFECSISGGEVSMTWRNVQTYDGFEILQGCEQLDTLPGTASSWSRAFGEGVYDLTLRAFQGARSTSPPACSAIIGSGEVLRSAETGGVLPVDIATAGDLLLVTDAGEQQVMIFDGDFNAAGALAISEDFVSADDYLTGIAYSPGTIYLFNATASRVGLFDDVGAFLASFEALLPNLEEDPQAEPDRGFVVGMDIDPLGNGGSGTLWLLESVRDRIYEIDLDGNVIRDFPHPYLEVEPPPEGTPFGIASSGICLVDGSPGRVLLGGGALRDLNQPHIFRADTATGKAVPGTIIPTNGIRKESTNTFFTFDTFARDGDPRIIVLTFAGKNSKLLELRGDPPVVAPPTHLRVEAGYADEAVLEFTPNGTYDAIEVHRDCEKVADLPGNATVHVDRGASPGKYEYWVRGIRNGTPSDFVRAAARIGKGAVTERAFTWPARSPQQLTRDPVDGSYYVAVNWPGDERKLFVFDPNLRYVATRETVVEPPWEIAAVAIRAPPGGDRELHYITWQLPVPIGEVASQRFLLITESYAGGLVRETEISPPRPTNGFVTYPTGLSWHPGRDTFFFLERNSKTFVEMTPAGDIVNTFPHPAPPFQNFVFNLGADVVPERQSLFITGSGRLDHKVTRVLEMDLQGSLTGYEIPLDGFTNTVTGITVSGGDLIAIGTSSFSEIFRIKAFPDSVPGFIRGDADGNGGVNVSDPIFILEHLFRGGRAPRCEDAADADDSGRLDTTDPILILDHLFRGGSAPPAPYPFAGADPTPDTLACS
jgi:DNA-binding beta-propeller fold protein YncE